MQVERQRLGRAIAGVMGGEIGVPFEPGAGEPGFRIDLDLLDIEVLAQDLHCWFDQARVAHKPRVGFAAPVQ